MPSMVLVISSILLDEAWMPSIVATIVPTTSPPRLAACTFSVVESTMRPVALRTWLTMRRSDSCIVCSVCISRAASSLPQARGRVVRSPSRMASMWKATSFRPPSSTLPGVAGCRQACGRSAR